MERSCGPRLRGRARILRITALVADGHWFIGFVVLMCSLVLPAGKLIALLVLSMGGVVLGREALNDRAGAADGLEDQVAVAGRDVEFTCGSVR